MGAIVDEAIAYRTVPERETPGIGRFRQQARTYHLYQFLDGRKLYVSESSLRRNSGRPASVSDLKDDA